MVYTPKNLKKLTFPRVLGDWILPKLKKVDISLGGQGPSIPYKLKKVGIPWGVLVSIRHPKLKKFDFPYWSWGLVTSKT